FLTNPELEGLRANEFGVRRRRSLDSQMHERIEVWCFARTPRQIEVRLSACNDFADLFEIKDEVRDRAALIARDHTRAQLRFAYRNGPFVATTEVMVDPHASTLDGDDLVWNLDLGADETWELDITVPLGIGPNEVVPRRSLF